MALDMSAACGWMPWSLLLFVQDLVDEGDGDRSFADGRRHTLDVACPHVADREHAGQARFEQMRRARQRPMRGGQVVLGQVGPGLDEPLGIERDAAVEPARVGSTRPS